MKHAISLLKFQQRKCKAFIPREYVLTVFDEHRFSKLLKFTRVNKNYCVCNQHKSAHSAKTINEHMQEEWDWELHTEQEATKCYGMLPQSNSAVCKP